MIYLEKFWNHLRESDGEEIFGTIFLGCFILLIALLVGLIVYGLFSFFGIWAVLAPVALVLILVIIYGVGWVGVKLMDKHDGLY